MIFKSKSLVVILLSLIQSVAKKTNKKKSYKKHTVRN